LDYLNRAYTTNTKPFKERVKDTQEQAKFHGIVLTWKKAKELTTQIFDGKIYKNSTYQVHVANKTETEEMILDEKYKNIGMTYLSIKRIDKEPIHDWRDLQEIKNQLCGKDREGMEIYPREDRVVDTANQYHLFVFPKDYRIPFGFSAGMKTNKEYNKEGRFSKQRPRENEE
jgi:hypothetical protein